jgi:hypothetical protein
VHSWLLPASKSVVLAFSPGPTALDDGLSAPREHATLGLHPAPGTAQTNSMLVASTCVGGG